MKKLNKLSRQENKQQANQEIAASQEIPALELSSPMGTPEDRPDKPKEPIYQQRDLGDTKFKPGGSITDSD